jgi:hypothetical protein
MRANKHAQSKGICKWDDIVEVRSLRVGERVHVGLYSHQPINGWGDLDGMVPSRQGLWQDSRHLLNFFELIHQDKVVVEDFNFKKRNLKGMRCKVIHHNSSHGQSFVEFDEDVGGGSADGLGKAGFCVVLPSELLENADESPKNDPKEKMKSFEGDIEVSGIKKEPWTTIIDELPKNDPKEKKVIVEKSVNYAKELWATISDSQTLDPEPIAIKAKIATKQMNKISTKKPTDNVDWEKAARRLWNEDNDGNEIKWIERSSLYSIPESGIFDPNPLDE